MRKTGKYRQEISGKIPHKSRHGVEDLDTYWSELIWSNLTGKVRAHASMNSIRWTDGFFKALRKYLVRRTGVGARDAITCKNFTSPCNFILVFHKQHWLKKWQIPSMYWVADCCNPRRLVLIKPIQYFSNCPYAIYTQVIVRVVYLEYMEAIQNVQTPMLPPLYVCVKTSQECETALTSQY